MLSLGRAVEKPPLLGRALCCALALSIGSNVCAQGPPRAEAPGPVVPAAVAPAAEEVRVIAIELIGSDKRTKVMEKVKTRAGQIFNRDVIDRDVRELNRSGMFVEVRTRLRSVPGGIVVVFEVVERPTLKYVTFLGNDKVKDKKLGETTNLKPGGPMSPYEIEMGRRKIEEFYRERGYSRVQVTILEGSKATDGGAVYSIHEGPCQKVLWTDFVGNTIVRDDRLRTQVQSKPGVAWVFKGYVDRKKIDEDVERLTSYYRSLGFFRAQVRPKFNEGIDDHWVTVRFFIHEGPRYAVRNVTFQGNEKIPTERLVTDLKLAGGEPFDQVKLNKDISKIRDEYGGAGYVFADVKPDTRFLEEPGKVDLVYTIKEGARYRIGRVNVVIEGEAPHTRRKTVMNHVSLRPGDIADIRQIRSSQNRLQRSGLFEMDPSRGVAPQIKFAKANEVDPETGRTAKGRSGVRGQSPDEEERWIDLTIDGDWHD